MLRLDPSFLRYCDHINIKIVAVSEKIANFLASSNAKKKTRIIIKINCVIEAKFKNREKPERKREKEEVR